MGLVNYLAVFKPPSIQSLVYAQILSERGSLQRDTRNNTPCSRPGQNLRCEFCVRQCVGRAADRTGGYITFASQCELAGEQPISALLVHNQKNGVGFRSADLKSHAATFYTNRVRGRPIAPSLFAARQESFPVLGPDNEDTMKAPFVTPGTITI